MNYTKTLVRKDGSTISEQGEVQDDRFSALLGNAQAQIEVLVGTTVGFGDAKVHVALRLSCNQDEATIERAGQLAYLTAKDLATAALDNLAPPVQSLISSPPSAGRTG